MNTMIQGRRGQGMTEYIIIVALVAIAAIGIVSLFGDNLRMLFGGTSNALAGDENVLVKTQLAHERHLEHKTLKNFGAKNQGAT